MSFEVVPAVHPQTSADWLRAKTVAASELPALTEQLEASARRLGVNEEQYRRFQVYLPHFISERQRKQGEAFGGMLEGMLAPLHERYSLLKLDSIGNERGWLISIRITGDGIKEFESRFDVVRALVEGTAFLRDLENFRLNLLTGLGEDVAVSEMAG